MSTILGIETSCDETAAAVVVDGKEVLSNVVSSQIDLHKKFGGVVPEIASRAHLETLDAIVLQAMAAAGCEPGALDAIAVTNRPGLVACLIIGVTAAKTFAWSTGRPIVAINHVHAHATSPAMTLAHDPWSAVALVVSGGHTSLYHVRNPMCIELMGSTTDDACGEAYDKVASILNLGYPGGPVMDRIAARGNGQAVRFPRSLLGRDTLDFSFSGIKTAVLYHVHGPGKTSGGLEKLSSQDVSDIAASFQAAVVEVLVGKTMLAAEQAGVATVLAGGGVVANSALRRELQKACNAAGMSLHLADLAYCTDNAAMIAAHAHYLLRSGKTAGLDMDASATEQHELMFA